MVFLINFIKTLWFIWNLVLVLLDIHKDVVSEKILVFGNILCFPGLNWAQKWTKTFNFGYVLSPLKHLILKDCLETVFLLRETTSGRDFSKLVPYLGEKEFNHISVGYVQKTAQKQPKIVPSKLENYKSDINETWPRYVTAEYLQHNKNEGTNEWAGGDAIKTTTRKCHEIKRNLTWTFKTSLENAKEIWIFHCHP